MLLSLLYKPLTRAIISIIGLNCNCFSKIAVVFFELCNKQQYLLSIPIGTAAGISVAFIDANPILELLQKLFVGRGLVEHTDKLLGDLRRVSTGKHLSKIRS